MADEVRQPHIVKILPGVSSEKAIWVKLPDDGLMDDCSVEKILSYARHDQSVKELPKNVDIIPILNLEMKGKYGVVVGGETVQDSARIGNLFEKKTSPQGRDYQELEISVAAKQEGGLERLAYMR